MRARPVATLLCVLALIALPGCRGGGDAPPPEEAPADEAATVDEGAEEEAPEQEASVAPLPQSSVEIYFPSALDNGLVGEFREIFNTATPGDRAKQIVNNLIEGPQKVEALRAVPPGVRLRQAFVMQGGTVYLDFSSELTEGVAGGSMAELMTVYAIINSVALNVREARRVQILVNGRPLETLNGHLDLRRPLRPDTSLILGSIIVQTLQRDEPAAGVLASTLAAPPGSGK